MTIFYIFIAYVVVSSILFLLMYFKFLQKEKKIETNIQNMTHGTEQAIQEVLVEKPEDFTVVENPVEEINLQIVQNPDKDKPFARISSPSYIETSEYNQTENPIKDTSVKKKRKYVKKMK